MKRKYFLIEVSGVLYVALNAHKPLLNCQCNSQLFSSVEASRLEMDVFDFCGARKKIIKQLDLRTKEAKRLIKSHGWFSVNKILNKDKSIEVSW